MADTPKTVAEALQEAIRSCDVKRDHNYRMGADSFTITTAEYAALRALSTQVAQRDEARELLRDSLPFLRAAHFIYFAAPRDRLVAKINAFLARAEGAKKVEGRATLAIPANGGGIVEQGTAPSTPDMERDAARWRAATRIGWPEYCPHWEGAPNGDGWYHALTGERRFDTANAAIDAAIAQEKNRG